MAQNFWHMAATDLVRPRRCAMFTVGVAQSGRQVGGAGQHEHHQMLDRWGRPYGRHPLPDPVDNRQPSGSNHVQFSQCLPRGRSVPCSAEGPRCEVPGMV